MQRIDVTNLDSLDNVLMAALVALVARDPAPSITLTFEELADQTKQVLLQSDEAGNLVLIKLAGEKDAKH